MDLEVTWDTIPDPAIEALPMTTQDRMNEVFQTIHNNPAEAVGELRDLIEQHPDIPCLKSWLTSMLGSSHDKKERAEAADPAERLFRERPDYFFARISLAECLVVRGEVGSGRRLAVRSGEDDHAALSAPEALSHFRDPPLGLRLLPDPDRPRICGQCPSLSRLAGTVGTRLPNRNESGSTANGDCGTPCQIPGTLSKGEKIMLRERH